MIKTCQICKNDFKTSHSKRKNCSRDCYAISRKGIKPKYSFTTVTAKKHGFKKGNQLGFKKGYIPWNKGKKIGKSGMSGKKHTDESRKKMSINSARFWKGKKFSNKHRENLSLNHGDFNDSNSPNWKGEDVGNAALHQWVAKHKGRPMRCEYCGRINLKNYDWANIDHQYKRNLNDFIRLCRSCHRLYDIKFNNYGKN